MNRRPWPDSQKSQKSKFSFSSLNSFYLTLLFFFFIYLLLSAHLSFVSLSFLISISLLICRSYLSIYCSLSLCYYFTFLFIYLLSVTFSFCLSFFPFSLFLTFYYPIFVFLPYQPRSLSLSLSLFLFSFYLCVPFCLIFSIMSAFLFHSICLCVFSISVYFIPSPYLTIPPQDYISLRDWNTVASRRTLQLFTNKILLQCTLKLTLTTVPNMVVCSASKFRPGSGQLQT